MTNDVLRLPAYPSTNSRKSLSASQLATLNQTVASTLSIVLGLSPQKRDTASTRTFLRTYARDTAFQVLQNLIWRASSRDESQQWPRSTDEKHIHKRSLLLSEKLPGLDLQILLDLSIIYARTQPTHLQHVFTAAAQSDAALSQTVANDLLPGFTALLQQESTSSQGLYAQRKVAECVFAFLRGAKATPELVRPFARSKEFVVALASLYDVGMTAIATSYGGTAGMLSQDRAADEWETIWVETKVALLDAFHVVLSVMLDDLAACSPGPRLAAEAERTFDTIFALLEAPSSSSTGTPVPFLNQSLLADYQHAYSFSKLLAGALRHAQEKDARLDLLESTLQSLAAVSEPDNKGATKDTTKGAGALKILLRSSGIQPGIDNLGTRNTRAHQPPPSPPPLSVSNSKGKGKSRADVDADPELDLKATQVLDILPDTPVRYVKLLLAHHRYGRDPEKVIGALLEGTALGEDELELELHRAEDGRDEQWVEDGKDGWQQQQAVGYSVNQRRNVFDSDELDISRLRIGKKGAGEEVLRDRTFIEQMKADILRRAEAISDEEDEEDVGAGVLGDGKGKDKAVDRPFRAVDLGPDEDEDDGVALSIGGDGEDSGDDDEEDEEDDEREEHQTPETIIEQAYLADPKVFERDAATRRSKARADLKAQTGWKDEQIEGWKIMLERSPALKDKLAEKYAFRGNEKGLKVHSGGASRGRGRGAPRGRGRGGPPRGGGSGGGGGGGSSARERAWKDKNKASRGNHNRKRGHDKKMARAGAVAGPST